MKLQKSKKDLYYKGLAIVFWFSVWELIARILDNSILIATPLQVGKTLMEMVVHIDFWETILFSSFRIVLGFFLAIMVGILFAILSSISRLFYELMSPLLKVTKAMPVASFIILALVWITSKNLSILISFLMVLPVVFANVYQGISAADGQLLQMARVFRLSRTKKIKAIYIPSMLPYLLSAISAGLGMGFKAGVAAEVIGHPAGSIGRQLYEAKLYLMTKELFAWSVVIIIISIVFEKAVLWIVHQIQAGR